MQTTLKQEIKCDGIGLHSGSKVSLKIKPSAAQYGIWFRRTDINAKDKKVWTVSEITKLKPAQYLKVEKEIDLARREGRIRN